VTQIEIRQTVVQARLSDICKLGACSGTEVHGLAVLPGNSEL
jgi:hypothetical protein